MDARIQTALVTVQTTSPPPTAWTLASQLRLSRSRFEHLFRQETGQAFGSYLRRVRLAKGASLLDGCDLSVKEVAGALGYRYPQEFSRDFKTHYGVSPMCYKMSTLAAKSGTK